MNPNLSHQTYNTLKSYNLSENAIIFIESIKTAIVLVLNYKPTIWCFDKTPVYWEERLEWIEYRRQYTWLFTLPSYIYNNLPDDVAKSLFWWKQKIKGRLLSSESWDELQFEEIELQETWAPTCDLWLWRDNDLKCFSDFDLYNLRYTAIKSDKNFSKILWLVKWEITSKEALFESTRARGGKNLTQELANLWAQIEFLESLYSTYFTHFTNNYQENVLVFKEAFIEEMFEVDMWYRVVPDSKMKLPYYKSQNWNYIQAQYVWGFPGSLVYPDRFSYSTWLAAWTNINQTLLHATYEIFEDFCDAWWIEYDTYELSKVKLDYLESNLLKRLKKELARKKAYLKVFKNPMGIPTYQITDWNIVGTWANLDWGVAITRAILEYLPNSEQFEESKDIEVDSWVYIVPNYSTWDLQKDLKLIRDILSRNDQILDYINLSQMWSNIKVLRAFIFSKNPKKRGISKHIILNLRR